MSFFNRPTPPTWRIIVYCVASGSSAVFGKIIAIFQIPCDDKRNFTGDAYAGPLLGWAVLLIWCLHMECLTFVRCGGLWEEFPPVG
jgi:hypothetical protein